MENKNGSTPSSNLEYRPRLKRRISAFLTPWNKTVCLFCGDPLGEKRHNSASFEGAICTKCHQLAITSQKGYNLISFD